MEKFRLIDAIAHRVLISWVV